jgi:uncharacterized protein (TIGR02145 family)
MMVIIEEKYSNLILEITKCSFKTLVIIILCASFVAFLSYCTKEESIPPVVLTVEVTGITTTSAVSGGNITSDGGSKVIAKGVCWNKNTNPTIENFKTKDGKGSGSFESNLTNLQPGTIYYVKAYATNKEGTNYGFETAFTTIAITPSLTTTPAADVTTNSATSGGNISSDGGFEVTARGVCWDTLANPTISNSHTTDGTGIGDFESCITGLLSDARYYVRAYATNSGGTAYGYQISFTTFPEFSPIIFNPDLTYGSVSDIDGNIYKTIEIGTQTWMAENLKTTKYNDGSPIPNVTDDSEWSKLTTPAYCWLFNKEEYFKAMYGAIYNYYAVTTGRLCPTGWHVSTKAEWDTLANFLGGANYHGSTSDVGGKLKEAGTSHWKSPNTGATNSSGFTALPGGTHNLPSFWGPEYQGRWWCSDLWAVKWLQYNTNTLDGVSCNSQCGFNVRCVKDD